MFFSSHPSRREASTKNILYVKKSKTLRKLLIFSSLNFEDRNKKKTCYASQKFNETPSTSAAPIQTRRSRVMHVEDKSKAFRQVVRKDQLAKLQEVRTAPEHWTQQNYIGRRRMMNPIRRNPELKSKKNFIP